MILRGIDFGHVFNASGGCNFDRKQGWRHHRWLHPFGLQPDFTNSTFIAKTVTIEARPGNMPLEKEGIQPINAFPDCIVVKMWSGHVLNAVGLSNHGLEWMLQQGWWQNLQDPFFLSFAAVKQDAGGRIKEWRHATRLFEQALPFFQAPCGLQLNLSCPNTEAKHDGDLEAFSSEVNCLLDITSELDIPLVVKVNALLPVEIAATFASHPECDALVVSNTIPYGHAADRIPWVEIFGSAVSPLAKYGGGGLSGPALLPLVCDWLKRAERINFPKPIIACGGIMDVSAIDDVLEAGPTLVGGVELGSVSITRPWRVQKLIRHANDRFAARKDLRHGNHPNPRAG